MVHECKSCSGSRTRKEFFVSKYCVSSVNINNAVTCMSVTIDGVRIDDRIYWTL
jgi:hypothetical protein